MFFHLLQHPNLSRSRSRHERDAKKNARKGDRRREKLPPMAEVSLLDFIPHLRELSFGNEAVTVFLLPSPMLDYMRIHACNTHTCTHISITISIFVRTS